MKHLLGMLCLSLCVWSASFTVRAAIAVVDFSNLSQSITQVTHAATQIQNQIQQISQMAQTLQTLGGSEYGAISAGLTQQVQTMQSTLGNLTQISQSMNAIRSEFDTLFPDQAAWDSYDFSDMGDQLNAWSQEVDNAAIEALQAQAVTQRAALNVQRMNALLTAGQAAEGEVRQLQLLNQSMGILSMQMNDTLQLLAANGRVQALQAAQQQKAREAARERKQRMLQGLGTATYQQAPLTHLP